jgi:di/tricarboxylate transporter
VTWEAWLTAVVIVGVVVLLARDVVPPVMAVLGATVLLLVVGVIDAGQAFAGFSNPAPITVAALYVLARAVEVSGALDPVVAWLMGEPAGGDGPAGGRSRTRRRIARLVLPAATGSAFLNNTPIVAALAPQVLDWAKRRGISASPLLMPLSFAAIVGGMVTVIGTSTNLVVSGLLQDAGFDAIGMFELSRVGLPVAVVAVVLLVLVAPVLLPDRRGPAEEFDQTVREFTLTMLVEPGGPVDGSTLEGAGLRGLQGVFCIQVERDGYAIAPVAPSEPLRGGDLLTFAGRVDQIVDLQRKRGLASPEAEHIPKIDDRRQAFFEAVIGGESPLVGRTLKEAGFRDRYRGAVLAVHRAGRRVDAKPGEIRLQVGDTLLVVAGHGFRERWRDGRDFLLVAPLDGHTPARTRKAPLVGVVAAALVLLAGAGVVPILEAALVAAFALVALRVLTVGEARDAVDLSVVILIASAFGLAAAMTTTGLATAIAEVLVAAFSPLGLVGALLGVIVATTLLTETITNNAAAALMFPIAISTAQAAGGDPRPFAIAVAIAASASFLTPIGYQTNTIVYGLGGYRFTDYVRLGLPLTLLVWVTAALVIPLAWPLAA